MITEYGLQTILILITSAIVIIIGILRIDLLTISFGILLGFFGLFWKHFNEYLYGG